jgi:hypothetical protein
MSASPDVQKIIEKVIQDQKDKLVKLKNVAEEFKKFQSAPGDALDPAVVAEFEKNIEAELKEVAEWEDEIPESVTPRQLAAAVAYVNLFPVRLAQFKVPDFADEINSYLDKLSESNDEADQQFIEAFDIEYSNIFAPLQEALVTKQYQFMAELQENQVRAGTSIKTEVVPSDNGDWTVVTFPISIDRLGNVTVPETLDFDVYLNAYVTTPGNGLKDVFNAQAHFVPKGQKFEPYVFSVKDPGKATQVGYLSGILENPAGQQQPILSQFLVSRQPG